MTSDAVNGRFVAGCRRMTAALPNFDNSLRQPLQQITGKLNRKLAEAGGSSFCSPGELEKSGTSEQRAHIPMEKGGALFPFGASALNSTFSSVGSARSEVLKHHRDIKKAVFGDGFQGVSRSHTKKPGGLSDENCPLIEKSTRISSPAADKGISRQIAGDLAVVSHGLSRSHTKISNPAADQGISLVSEAATDFGSLEEMTLSEYEPDDLSPRSTKSKIEKGGALFPIGASALNSTFSSVGSARSEVLKRHRNIKKAGDGFQGFSRSHTKKPGGLSDETGDLAVVSHGLSRSHTKISNPAADQGISLVSEAATDFGSSEEMTLSEYEPDDLSPRSTKSKIEKGGALFPIGVSALNSTFSSVGSARSEVPKHPRDIKKAVFGDGFQGLSRSHTKKPDFGSSEEMTLSDDLSPRSTKSKVVRIDGEKEEECCENLNSGERRVLAPCDLEKDYWYCYPKFMLLLELDPNLVMDLQSLEETHKNMTVLKQLADAPSSAPQEQPDNSSLLWLSVPYDVMGLILERLPQGDYIRFEAVCHDWQAVRQRHRCNHPRFKPHAIPWLMPQAHYRCTPCISMLEERIYRLTFPDYVSCMRRLFSSDGWILLYEGRWKFSEFLLLNPITREQIELPRLRHYETLIHGCMAPDPNDDNYSLIVVGDYVVYLWRRGDPNWISLRTNCEPARNVSSVYSVGIYYLKLMNLNYRRARRGDLLILNPAAPQPSLQLIEMEWEIDPLQVGVDFLVSVDLEIVLIQPLWAFGCKIFKVDLNQSMWKELQSFRGKTVFLSRSCCFAQSLEEIGENGNGVVFPRDATFCDWFRRGEGQNNVWRRYFVNSGGVDCGCVPASGTNQDVVIFLKNNLFWLVPSISMSACLEVEVDTSTLNTLC